MGRTQRHHDMTKTHNMTAALAATIVLIALIPLTEAGYHSSVPIRDVQSLTLRRGDMATGRRSSPVPQLTCVGGDCRHAPTTVRCINSGWDGRDVTWDCRAELDRSVKFGHLTVQCEGFTHPDDPNILAGSCGLQYTLEPTNDHSGHYEYDSFSRSPQPPGSLFGSLM